MTKVYGNYYQQALDLQYNPRLTVDFKKYADRWARDSAAIRSSASSSLDVRYGESVDEELDIYLAQGSNRPIHIFFHGGYWRSMNKSDFAFIAPGFRKPDTVCVVVNYTLCPAVTIGEIVRQCEAATAWVWRNAEQIGGDKNRISISGHSAGGHITAMLMATDWAALKCPPDVVKKAVAISGLYDLEPLRLSFLNEFIHLTAESALIYSPINAVPVSKVPMLFTLGSDESFEFHRQTEHYSSLWKSVGNTSEQFAATGLNHYSVMDEAYNPETDCGRRVFDWLV